MPPNNLPVRKLLVDLNQGFERHWFCAANGKPDAFRSMYFNAMSMSFPAGEQFFIDSVNALKDRLTDAPPHQRLKALIRDFAAQEATHRQVHGLMNKELEKQGLSNTWELRIFARNKRFAHLNPLHHLALTAAYEHYTAVMSELMLSRPELTAGMSLEMRQVWRWHAMEETEHKAVAFDLYQAVSGHVGWRRYWFFLAMLAFMTDSLRQTVRNLLKDGSLLKPRTFLSSVQFFFGRPAHGGGWVWLASRPLLAYLRKDFHPNALGSSDLAPHYAEQHAQDWRLVR